MLHPPPSLPKRGSITTLTISQTQPELSRHSQVPPHTPRKLIWISHMPKSLPLPAGPRPGTWGMLLGKHQTAPHTHLVIEKANLEDVFHAGNAVCHRQVTHGVPQQDDARPCAQLLEVPRALQHGVVLVVGVDEGSLEVREDSLSTWDKTGRQLLTRWCHC